jgi:hypothetical protein
MSKTKVTLLFALASVAVIVGAILALGAMVAGIAGGAITVGGPQIVTLNGAAFAGTLIWLAVASLLITAGSLAALASWVAALLNTARLQDRTWFIALLGLGLISLGWFAMIAYVVAGPDGSREGATGVVPAAV